MGWVDGLEPILESRFGTVGASDRTLESLLGSIGGRKKTLESRFGWVDGIDRILEAPACSLRSTPSRPCENDPRPVLCIMGRLGHTQPRGPGVVLKMSAMGLARASLMYMGGSPRTSSMVRKKYQQANCVVVVGDLKLAGVLTPSMALAKVPV